MAYAPTAIRSAATTITGGVGGAVFSGVVGDAAHSYGYHLARNQLPGSDYSVQLTADRDGNGDAASALDISLPPDQMIAVTARLRAAAKRNDPRLYALREFAGTLDGRTTFNRDLSNGGEGFGQWDDSHLWHIHLSGYRRYADDADAWRAIADVFTDSALSGDALTESPEDDLNADQDEALNNINARTQNTEAWQKGEADRSTDARQWAWDARNGVIGLQGVVAGLTAAIGKLAGGSTDTAAIVKAAHDGAQKGAEDALSNLTLAPVPTTKAGA